MCADPQGMSSDTASRQTDNLSARVIGCQGCRIRAHRHTLSQVSVAVRRPAGIEPCRPWLPAPHVLPTKGLGAGLINVFTPLDEGRDYGQRQGRMARTECNGVSLLSRLSWR